MEDRLNYYLLDTQEAAEIYEAKLVESLAVDMLQDWICSDSFKLKATHREIEQETFFGRIKLKFEENDQFWKNEEYQLTRDLVEKVFEYWHKRKWCYVETKKNGRPRRAEYSQKTLSKAAKYDNPPFLIMDSEEENLYNNAKWGRSVLGTASVQTWVKVVIVKEQIFKEVYQKSGAEHFTGCTKEEIASNLHLPTKFVKEMCRWLESTGRWKTVRCERKGVTRREMRLSVA